MANRKTDYSKVKDITEVQSNKLACKIVGMLQGLPISVAASVLNDAKLIMFQCHSVDCKSHDFTAFETELEKLPDDSHGSLAQRHK